MTVTPPFRAARGLAGLCVAGILLSAVPDTAAAQDRLRIGYGRLVVNDSIGELLDRWQSAAIAQSRIWGQDWEGQPPLGFGEILEYRNGARIIAPESLRTPDEDDRRYAGILSFGLHTHFQRGGIEMSLGGDLVITGEQTQVGHVQTFLHDLIGIRAPSDDILDDQIDNGFHPTLVAEAGHELFLGRARLRPFGEMRVGAETYARVGADMTFGGFGSDGLMVREETTGQRYETVTGTHQGFSFLLGADVAQVASSVYLPDDGPDPETVRGRVRAGAEWRRGDFSVYYGATYLSEEFEGQRSGQVVGAARIRLSF